MYQHNPVTTFHSARISRFGAGGAILRSRDVLTDDQIRSAAPSVFAVAAHDSRSDRYTHIPTAAVLDGLRREGFNPYEVRQGGTRIEGKREFTKHLIRLRREGAVTVGDSVRELVLLNSHDGTSAYQLMSGMFRLVCSNGLVIADGEAQSIRVPHKGDVVSQVIDAAYEVIEDGARIDSNIESMRALQLHPDEQLAFARAAATLRFEDGKVPVAAEEINRARRYEDAGTSLWLTFNRAQENLTQGGLRYVERDANGRRVARRQTRAVNGIDGNVSLNRALWTLAAEMQKLKA